MVDAAAPGGRATASGWRPALGSAGALLVDRGAALVEALVEVALLGLGDVALVAGHVLVQAGLLARELGVVLGGLSGVDLAGGAGARVAVISNALDFIPAEARAA